MHEERNYSYFDQGSFSDLFANDIRDQSYAFLLPYPCTADWAHFPNNRSYLIQDGNSAATKVGYEKICQKEPWKNLAVLGDEMAGVLTEPPPAALLSYWREHLGFHYHNFEVLPQDTYCHDLNQSNRYRQLITLFPYDGLDPDRHAVDPDSHYHLLSKTALADMGVHYPLYQVFDFDQVRPEDVVLKTEYPYLIKTSHGLSGEGTYIIHDARDLDHCRSEVRRYLAIGLVQSVVVSDFVKHVVENYCVQFYVDKNGEPTLIGATTQLVTDTGEHLGGVIRYRETDMRKFFHKIAVISRFVQKHGYFGVVGVDILEDRDGQLHVIDANIRVNGSTPLCLLRHVLLAEDKETAKYSSDFCMDTNLDGVLLGLRPYLDRKDLTILSALERDVGGRTLCEIYGIVAGADVEAVQRIEQDLQKAGLYHTG